MNNDSCPNGLFLYISSQILLSIKTKLTYIKHYKSIARIFYKCINTILCFPMHLFFSISFAKSNTHAC